MIGVTEQGVHFGFPVCVDDKVGSTTGNLYVSEDRGDSWCTVANNLPQIYSVRFGGS